MNIYSPVYDLSRNYLKSVPMPPKTKPPGVPHKVAKRRKIVEEPEPENFSSDADSDEDELLCELNDKDSDTACAGISYREASANYNEAQKKLEPDHVYHWVNGENLVDDNLSNELLLSDTDKEEILRMSPVELFELFFSSEIKNYIVKATTENGYSLTTTDLDIFVGILVFSSFNKRPEQRDYWSKDPLLESPPVRTAMSRDKFKAIKSSLKFCLQEDVNVSDKVWKLRPIITIFQKNILKYGFFCTALSIDEMMVKFFGRLAFKQFIRAKPIRFGIKMWALCGSNGYLFFFDVYCGKNSQNGKLCNISQGSYVVLKMLEKLLETATPRQLGKYHVYFDNLFCSPDLLVHLKRLNIRATGVVRADRIKEKNEIAKKATKGTYIAKNDRHSGINYITARDSKDVSILSTAAGVTPLTPMNRYVKEDEAKVPVSFPNAFSKYNKFMGGVDLHDQFCNKLLSCIRSKKWTWVIFVRIIQSALTNACVLYNTLRSDDEKIGAKEVALQVSRDYLARKSQPLVRDHSLIQLKNPILCSTKECNTKCNKHCKTCGANFCKRCILEKGTCIETMEKCSSSSSEEHEVITADNRGYCGACKRRTYLFCKKCKYVCKACSKNGHQ